MKENYSSWNVNIDDFKHCQTTQEKNKFLIRFGILAPSSHNAQPWSFSVDNEGVDVSLDMERTLLIGDANNRQSCISLGCAIANIIIAADYYGYETKVVYKKVAPTGAPVARIILKNINNNFSHDDGHLFFSIIKRTTNRGAYKDVVLSQDFLNEINSFATDDEKAFVVIEKEARFQIADVAIAASVASMEDKNFRLELSQYLKSHTTSSPIGMPGTTLNMPLLVSYIVPYLVRYVNVNKMNAAQDEKLLKMNTPAFIVLGSKDDGVDVWVRIGVMYQKIALQATKIGLTMAMWAAPIQIEEFYKNLQKILNTSMRPQALFRVGYPTKEVRHSPRLPLGSVLK